jgi:predicted metalloprotease with PDZ domain
LFGVLLLVAVAAAVSTVVAQARPDPQPRPRPPVMMLDGRGAQIGVSVDDLNEQELKAAAGAASGVIIEDVDQDSPASRSGLVQGDIITEVDGERVRSARQFSRLIQETPDGRSVKLSVVRAGKKQAIDVTPEARGFGFGPDSDRIAREIERGMREVEPRLRELEPRFRELEPRFRELEPRLRGFRYDGPLDFNFDFPRMTSPRGRLGVQLNELTPQLAEYFGAQDGGVLVASVTKDSPADKAGVKAGDVIVSINGDRVRRTDDLIDELRDREGEISVGILREKKESTLKATIESETPRPGTRRPA